MDDVTLSILLDAILAFVVASIAYTAGLRRGRWTADQERYQWPVTWLLGLIFWLAAESR